jgi:hypothetical protein
MSDELNPMLAQRLDALRREGCLVIGPGPVSTTVATPTPDAPAGAGMHVQIGCGSRFVEGFGGTKDEAVSDALDKLEGYSVTSSVRSG